MIHETQKLRKGVSQYFSPTLRNQCNDKSTNCLFISFCEFCFSMWFYAREHPFAKQRKKIVYRIKTHIILIEGVLVPLGTPSQTGSIERPPSLSLLQHVRPSQTIHLHALFHADATSREVGVSAERDCIFTDEWFSDTLKGTFVDRSMISGLRFRFAESHSRNNVCQVYINSFCILVSLFFKLHLIDISIYSLF